MPPRMPFADTFYWVALLNPGDAFHARVTSFGSGLGTARLAQTRADFDAALALYEARSDKEYSLTDCRSLLAMKSLGLTEALTNDHHFTQEGFTILFPIP